MYESQEFKDLLAGAEFLPVSVTGEPFVELRFKLDGMRTCQHPKGLDQLLLCRLQKPSQSSLLKSMAMERKKTLKYKFSVYFSVQSAESRKQLFLDRAMTGSERRIILAELLCIQSIDF